MKYFELFSHVIYYFLFTVCYVILPLLNWSHLLRYCWWCFLGMFHLIWDQQKWSHWWLIKDHKPCHYEHWDVQVTVMPEVSAFCLVTPMIHDVSQNYSILLYCTHDISNFVINVSIIIGSLGIYNVC